ncbi:uncharacterized protein BXZ73DRAFT_77211 [Epithele typhae]|uniref:uncharacterized protein n=1 Tax=Epithele typhae TaxID=378194 RepID=UPI00200850E9|nr:uncharacterized protein BXZ73DRAFT_77211 [Epithele typhae]KAH9933586.1 hypothetical protein BXZ73DRAFT_77211 [Epithele typhae]
MGGANLMPPWPEILSKYDIESSPSPTACRRRVHPPPADAADGGRAAGGERRGAASGRARGHQGLAGHAAGAGLRGRLGGHPEYEDVLWECEAIRVERGTRAVELLRERYDWKSRVEVDQEEPEDWEPGLGGDGAGMGEDTPSGGQSNDSEEEDEPEEVLGNGEHTPECAEIPAPGILDFDGPLFLLLHAPRQDLKQTHDTIQMDWFGLFSQSANGLCDWQETFTSSALDHAETVGTYTVHTWAYCARSASSTSTTARSRRSSPPPATMRRRSSTSEVTSLGLVGHALWGDPLLEAMWMAPNQGFVEPYRGQHDTHPRGSPALRHCEAGTTFGRVLGTDTDVKCHVVSTSAYISNKQT